MALKLNPATMKLLGRAELVPAGVVAVAAPGERGGGSAPVLRGEVSAGEHRQPLGALQRKNT